MDQVLAGNAAIVLPYAPVVMGMAGLVRRRYPRVNGPLRVLVLLLATSMVFLFALGVVPAEATTGASVLRFVRCSLLLALESFGITFGLDRVGVRIGGTNGRG